MCSYRRKLDRRSFLKGITAAGLGSFTAAALTAAEKETGRTASDSKKAASTVKVPRRKFGSTGVTVPVYSLGVMFNALDNQIILKKSLDWGVNYWDTAHSYAGGNSEAGIGKFLRRNPELRKDVFIVSKASRADSPEEIEERLQTSLKRMNTDYIDLYYGVHGMKKADQLTDELKEWALSAKKRGLIKYFGFSTHKNMTKCLAAASKLDWIDGILTTYNFRVMQDTEFMAAASACSASTSRVEQTGCSWSAESMVT